MANQAFLHILGTLAVMAPGIQPHLLFCPTEYCDALAVPSVLESQYLRTIGRELLPEVRGVTWAVLICHVGPLCCHHRRPPPCRGLIASRGLRFCTGRCAAWNCG